MVTYIEDLYILMVLKMKIRDIEKWQDDYYPTREKIKRTKPRKKDLDIPKKGIIIKRTKK